MPTTNNDNIRLFKVTLFAKYMGKDKFPMYKKDKAFVYLYRCRGKEGIKKMLKSLEEINFYLVEELNVYLDKENGSNNIINL